MRHGRVDPRAPRRLGRDPRKRIRDPVEARVDLGALCARWEARTLLLPRRTPSTSPSTSWRRELACKLRAHVSADAPQ
eukprot:1771575-Rhodomonas_salina.1